MINLSYLSVNKQKCIDICRILYIYISIQEYMTINNIEKHLYMRLLTIIVIIHALGRRTLGYILLMNICTHGMWRYMFINNIYPWIMYIRRQIYLWDNICSWMIYIRVIKYISINIHYIVRHNLDTGGINVIHIFSNDYCILVFIINLHSPYYKWWHCIADTIEYCNIISIIR